MHKEESRSSRLWGNVSKTIIAGSLAVALVPAWTGMGAMAADGNPTVSSTWTSTAYAENDTTFVVESPKDETVFAKTDANGKVLGVYVVNRFAAGSGIVMDPANYLSVSNMTTSDALAQEDGKVEVRLQGSEPFYYEGEMAAETALPWNVSLTYYLDGKAIDPAELGGASGKLRIELSVVARTSAPEPGVSDFANSYVLQAQGTFDSAAFEMDENDSVMVAQVGGEAVVNCMVLPGESQTFVLEGTANNFTSSGWQISALPLSLAINIADQDTSQLTSATAQLESATIQLANGSSALAEGISEAAEGANGLDDGASELAAGVAELNAGAGQLAEGAGQLESGGAELMEGWKQLSEGSSELAAGTTAVSEGSAAYRSALESAKEEVAEGALLYNLTLSFYESALKDYVSSPTDENKAELDNMLQLVIKTSQATGAQQALQQALDGYSELHAGIGNLNAGAADLKAGADEFANYLTLYIESVDLAAEGVRALAAGIEEVAEGTGALVDGSEKLASGFDRLNEGADALKSGSNQLAASVQGMDAQVLAAIQEAIDAKLGSDFELHSYVAPENTNVNSVQFVYMVDGITIASTQTEAPDENAAEEPTEADMSFIDRIIAFFKGL